MNAHYWYARGYYDGRNHGYMADEKLADAMGDQARHSYRMGYDAGVTDYCDEVDA